MAIGNGAAVHPASREPVSARYDGAEVAWSHLPGKGRIVGSISAANGGLHCSANTRAILAPSSAFEDALVKYYFGNNAQGSFVLGQVKLYKFDSSVSKSYYSDLRFADCREDMFEFTNVPDGAYYVKISVTGSRLLTGQYGVSATEVGYSMMKRVIVAAGQEVLVNLNS